MSIEIVLPPISDDQVSNDLRHLTKAIKQLTGEDNVYGILGGEFGYGEEFKNEVFEMHPFYWGDCTCGFDDKEYDLSKTLSHEGHCYQTEVNQRLEAEGFKVDADGWLEDEGDFDLDLSQKYHERKSQVSMEVAQKYGLPEIGLYVHCTCSYRQSEQEWYAENDHIPECPIVVPNFRHFESDFQVSWYKYIGRGMEVNKDLTMKQWASIVEECLLSLKSQ